MSINSEDTAETDIVKDIEAENEPAQNVESADTLVFEKITDTNAVADQDDSATVVIDKIKTDEE